MYGQCLDVRTVLKSEVFWNIRAVLKRTGSVEMYVDVSTCTDGVVMCRQC